MSTVERQRWLDAVVAKIQGLPSTARSLVLAGDGGSGLDFVAASPISRMAVAEDDTDVTALQASETTYFIDSRGPYLYTQSGGNWTSENYLGDRDFCRPNTLVYSPPNNRFYFVASNLIMTRASLSSDPTPV